MKNKLDIITLKQENISDFAAARNKLLASSNTDWVMFIDSDEVVSKELETEISHIDFQNTSFSGYFIKRKIFFCGQFIGEDRALRLARKNAGKWKRPVHETWVIKGRVGILDNYIIHSTAVNLQSYIDKINKYAALHARENADEGKKSGFIKIIFYPLLKFFQNILWGRGLVFSMLQSFHSFLAWSELWISQRN